MRKTILQLLMLLPLCAMAYQRVSVHDPSIVWDPQYKTYYIFGSHRAAATTTNLMDWSSFTAAWATASSNNAANSVAFTTQQVKKVKIGGVERDFNNFNAFAWSSALAKNHSNVEWGSIDGNMWAPDVIFNKAMNKWCMYLSINGVEFNSSIILLTSDHLYGPYRYQAPVVISGFNMPGSDALSYKNTDLELALGEQASLPERYNKGYSWGSYWPHCIDPCVFYDEEGNLWMTYGSWSNGMWILQLDEETGLRDYNVTEQYGSDFSRGANVSKDPYYGIKIAGGRYHSGEASYVEHIGDYYYLFVTNGGLVANGGYQMRVFRSTSPEGPYSDSRGQNAIITSDPRNAANYGPGGLELGVNIFGAYGEWGYQAVGNLSERSQGHNSIIAAPDGRTYLVYHTRFQNWGESHQVRVHQVFLNEDGWLCAAPFEYSGETVTDADIASSQLIGNSDIVGTYNLLVHRYGLDHSAKELVTPVQIVLNANGTVSGAYNGTWKTTNGTSYFTITLGSDTYRGVMVEQTLEPTTEKTPAFTVLNSSTGVTAWGYKASSSTTIEVTVGATNNSTAYLGAFSAPLQIKDGQMAVFEFTNYSSKTDVWNNWVACLSPNTTFNIDDENTIALRADNWENKQFSADGITNNYTWNLGEAADKTDFLNKMDGSTVEVKFIYLNGTVTIRADITTAGGETYYEQFVKTGYTGTLNCWMSVDKSHLVITRAEVLDATAISTPRTTVDSQSNIRYNLAGQRVGDDYKGLVIVNGKKMIVR